MDPISLEELGLMDVLHRIDQGIELDTGSASLRTRLGESGLTEEDPEFGMRLTEAGIERCKALRHRVAADAEAALVLQEREEESGKAEKVAA